MIYLDADIQVFDNIDHLFDAADGYFYAVLDCFCEKTWSHSPQYKVGYCQQCPDKVAWPAEMGSPPPLYFNAGMFVFEPSRLTYENLLHTLQVAPPTPFAEQVSQINSFILQYQQVCKDTILIYYFWIYFQYKWILSIFFCKIHSLIIGHQLCCECAYMSC